MFVSKGRLVVKTPTFPFTPATTSDWFYTSEGRGFRWAGYDGLYKRQLWVGVVVNKRARGVARLPLKVYLRDELNRPEARDHPYSVLLRRPNPSISPFRFWEWVSATYDVYGEAFLLKLRDRGGRPYALAPLHPTGMTFRNGAWFFDNGTLKLDDIAPADVIVFKTYHPTDMTRGLSPLERLRDTLENEANARASTSSFWANGARPGFALTHPANLSEPAQLRLRAQWDSQHGGARNTGSTLILEEGMVAAPLSINNEDAQYVETRKLNREEVCAEYDVPPPVVHILDHATYSNITEQMRSMYRDTMAPHLKGFESDLDAQLRVPDFGEEVYAEFLMDEVLRGDFEQRAEAYKAADYMTVAEKRKAENLPYIEGTDVILVNTASQPLDQLNGGDGKVSPTELASLLQKLYLAVGPVISKEEARSLANEAGADLGPLPDEVKPEPAVEPPLQVPAVRLDQTTVRSVMGRLSWQKSLDQVDALALVVGLSSEDGCRVLEAVSLAADVADLKARLKALSTKELTK